jgi:cytochrome c2
MLNPKPGDRVLVATCKNCGGDVVLFIDPTDSREIAFEEGATVTAECHHCHEIRLYGENDVRWDHFSARN